MSKARLTLNILAVAIFTLTVASMAQAQATRTWVSGVGDDANPCSRTAPCKTFAGAISKTATNGEIDALDPGGFGAVTVTKSITIDGSPTGEAGVLNAGTTGVIVNITNVADTRHSVTLRGLAINGAGTGLQGINIVSGNIAGTRVYVENCILEGQNGNPGNGITDAASNGGFLEVNNTTIINNSGNGISVNPGVGSTERHVHVVNSRVQGNGGSGLLAGSNVKATLFNSVFNQNVASGILAQQTAGGTTEVAVDQCVVSNNVTGFSANSASTIIRVSNTTAMNNTVLAATAGGSVSSYGNNQTAGAAFPSAPTLQT